VKKTVTGTVSTQRHRGLVVRFKRF